MPATCGGYDVLRAHVALPRRGPCVIEVVLDTPNAAPPSQVTFAEAGGLSLACTVARGGVNPALLKWEGVLVGGDGGLARPVAGSFNAAQVRDVLGAIASQAGEVVSAIIDATVLSLEVPDWTLGRLPAAAALDGLADFVAAQLGQPVTWRTLGDGSIWIGVETWPAQALPATAEIVEPDPMLGRTVIACEVAALLPGVALEGVGNIVAVDHEIEADEVRTWAWT
jgi:hypothetical protein